MLSQLDTYDWAEVFGEGSGGNCTPIMPMVCPILKDTLSAATFSREDVAEIHGQSEGEREERDWIVWGKLKDGRWFMARGGCDYTGWDCQASNGGDVADTRENIIKFGITDEEKERFGLKTSHNVTSCS